MVIYVEIWQLSGEASDACVESCLCEMAVKGFFREHFPAFSPKVSLFVVLDSKMEQCLSKSEMVSLTVSLRVGYFGKYYLNQLCHCTTNLWCRDVHSPFAFSMIICPTAQLSPRLTGRKPQDFPLEVHLILWIIDGHELIPREKMLGYWWHDKKPVHHPALQFLSKDTPSPPFPSRVVLVSVYFAATPSQRQALILRSTVPKQPCHLPHAAAPLPKIHRWSAQVNFSF